MFTVQYDADIIRIVMLHCVLRWNWGRRGRGGYRRGHGGHQRGGNGRGGYGRGLGRGGRNQTDIGKFGEGDINEDDKDWFEDNIEEREMGGGI